MTLQWVKVLLAHGILLEIEHYAFTSSCMKTDRKESNASKSTFKYPTVILISFDGFRWDYIQRLNLKNFQRIIDNGVTAKSLESSFITKTFPNHLTLVTGLHEESHGIIANKMYDPVFNQTFKPSTTDPKWWNSSRPIWIENELFNSSTFNSGKRRRSATIFWVGSNIEYDGKLPYFYMPVYNSSFPFEDRFKLIVKLLKKDQPPNFIACYFHEPDATGHKFGPDSKQMNKTLTNIDRLLGRFLDDLEWHGFLNHVSWNYNNSWCLV